jgi:hypothetical protein
MVEQGNMTGLAHQQPKPDDAQVVSFALRVSPLRKLTRGRRRNMRVEICRVECEHVRRQLEALHRSARDLDLGGGELVCRDSGGQPVERLAAEGSCRKARDPRQRAIQKLRQVPLGTWGGRPLNRHREHHLADRCAGLARTSASPRCAEIAWPRQRIVQLGSWRPDRVGAGSDRAVARAAIREIAG